MTHDDVASRLSRISTVWTLVTQTNGDTPLRKPDSHLALIQRYQGAVYRYLLAAVHDPDVADELFQEFALRVVQGRFSCADPAKGRFRDYLKSALIHLVTDHYRGKKKQRLQPTDPADIPDVAAESTAEFDGPFLDSLRDEFLARAWVELSEIERRGGPAHFTLLRFRADHPTMKTGEMVAALAPHIANGRAMTEDALRKSLQRARATFADLLLADVSHSLGKPTRDELQQELNDLGLLSYCRSALSRR